MVERPQKLTRTHFILAAIFILMAFISLRDLYNNLTGFGPVTAAYAGGMPTDLPRQTAKAKSMARYWKSDAALTSIDLEQGQNYAPTYGFYSPGDGSSMTMSTSPNGDLTPMPVSSGVNTSHDPLPPQYIDLPAAIASARQQGMPSGAIKMATLDVESVNKQPPAAIWSIQVDTDHPPYLYTVNAVSGSAPTDTTPEQSAAAQINNGPAHSNLMSWMTAPKLSADAEAQWQKGVAFYDRKDFANALTAFTQAAQGGHPRAMATLGNMYYNGEGVPKDFAKAIEWYKQAAELGNRGAQYSLGGMYEDGEGAPVDLKEAARLYEQSARQGMPEAQFALGLSYEFGEGVTRNRQTAIYWLRQAGAQGDGRAQWHADWLSRPDTPQFKDEAAFGQYISGKVSARVWAQMAAGNSAHVGGGSSSQPEYERGDKASFLYSQGDHAAAQRCANGGSC